MAIPTAKRVHKARDKRRDAPKRGQSSAPSRRAGEWVVPPSDDEEAWLVTYLPAAFPLPFGQVHRDIIAAVRYAIQTGGHVAIAAPRGTGKSTLVNGLMLRALLLRLTSFPVVVPWDDRAKRRALRFWAQELCFNSRLHRDYPEATDVFRRSRGIANRLVALTEGEEATGARLGITEGVIVLPHGLGAIGSGTLNGNPRGLYYSAIDGSIIRPTIAIVDDPQDREVAKSAAQVRDTIERIDGDVAGMAGPSSRMPIVMSCTVIAPGDVAEHYLSHPDWRSIRVGQVTRWPDGWDEEQSTCRQQWAAWNELRLDDETGATSLAYYREHGATMTAGMAVSWAERFDRARGQPDAFYSAILDWHVMGNEAFMAERQNAPIVRVTSLYELTSDHIAAHVTDRQAWTAPDGVQVIVAGADVNPSYGLSWVVVGFEANHTAHVLGYGIDRLAIPHEWSEPQKMQAVYAALYELRKKLAGLPCRPAKLAYDVRGWNRDHALAFGAQAMRDGGLPAIPAQGMSWKYYRPTSKTRVGEAREGCHMASDGRHRYLVVHSDYWREIMQRAWTAAPGAPGSCDLPAGKHRELVDQLLCEPLRDKKPGPLGMEWLFDKLPGKNDLSDAMVMAYAQAAYDGIGTTGDAPKPMARSRVLVSRPSMRRR